MIVVIPTHRRTKLLRRTLASLACCRLPETYARTVVIENGGLHGAKSICAEADPALRIEYRYELRGNKSHALNQVLANLDDELVVFFDDDVRLHPEVLLAYDRAARGVQRGVFFGGPTLIDYETVPPPYWMGDYLPTSLVPWSLPVGTTDVTEACLLGFNWAAFAADLRQAAGFDPAVGPGSTTGSTGQETDMQRRLLERGVVGHYVSDASVWHYVSAEQVTPKWLLQRAWRHAVHGGLTWSDPSPRLFRAPRWMWRRVAAAYLTALRTSLSGSEETRFRAWYEYWSLRGILHGCRRSDQSSRPVPAPPKNSIHA